ncbi:MAG: hypothetical protein K0R00_3180 [Herbinix sp.]|nr:hypothetical protein [Herbinix sp.]
MPFYTAPKIPSVRHPIGHSVNVMVTTNAQGKIRVDYLRIIDDEGEVFTYKITYSHLRKRVLNIETYDCEYITGNMLKYVTLIFDVVSMSWVMG